MQILAVARIQLAQRAAVETNKGAERSQARPVNSAEAAFFKASHPPSDPLSRQPILVSFSTASKLPPNFWPSLLSCRHFQTIRWRSHEEGVAIACLLSLGPPSCRAANCKEEGGEGFFCFTSLATLTTSQLLVCCLHKACRLCAYYKALLLFCSVVQNPSYV